MNLEYAISQMTANAAVVRQLLQDVSQAQSQWRPDVDSWSALEVINHLYDEEREDFRTRLDYMLHRPGEPWPPIDPGGWVKQRDYNGREMRESVDQWRSERQASLEWLKHLKDPDWTAEHKAPWGVMTPGDMLASWVSHDLLHIRQLVELRYAYTARQIEPYNPQYAGEW